MFAPLKTETIQALLDEARYLDTKPPVNHDMRRWRCGSVSCAVGDMMEVGACGLGVVGDKQHGNDEHPAFGVLRSFEAVEAALGITSGEAAFMFNSEDIFRRGDRITRSRGYETPQKTAARIRKFLYYRLHKMEILADYERARHQEGNWNVCQHAAREASLVSA